MYTFLKCRPFGEISKLSSKFVLPEFGAPTMRQRTFGGRKWPFFSSICSSKLGKLRSSMPDATRTKSMWKLVINVGVCKIYLTVRGMAKLSLVDRLIKRLPFEMHLPTYRFCGPGTALKKRLARGERGIDPLDNACMEHDIAYAISEDPVSRARADRKLINFAESRIRAADSNLKEKMASHIVSLALTAKQKIGMGLKRKKKQIKRGGFLSPALLSGIAAAANLINAGSNLYKLAKKKKKGEGLAGKKKRRGAKRKKKRLGAGIVSKRRRRRAGAGYFLAPYKKKQQKK